ncbi:MAG: lysophospholipid acyltransferase family protein, partial [Verrucomicrobiota bacterium]
AKKRIRDVFGDEKSEAEVKRIAWISMRNMFFNAVEVLRAPIINQRWIEKHNDITEIQVYHDRIGEQEGAVFALPHMGNWDMGGFVAIRSGLRIIFLAGVQRNPLYNRYMLNVRARCGIESIPRDSKTLVREMIKCLRNGKILAMTNDLRSNTPGVTVDYLGKPANIGIGMAKIAHKTNSPIFPCCVIREGWTRHVWHVKEPLRLDPDLTPEEDLKRITQAIMNYYESMVRAQPEQYFWYNKRWVLDPYVPPGSRDQGVELRR